MVRLNALVVLVALSLVNITWAVSITVNEQKEFQTIIGFGGHDPAGDVNRVVDDLGLTAHRAQINSDGSSTPSWATLKALKDKGVKVFFATPWSPPASYKYVNAEFGGDHLWNRLANGLGPMNDYLHPTADPEKGAMRNYYPDMAQFLVNYIKAFKQNVGIDLTFISPQNEPDFAEPYASCVYTPWQYRDIVWELGKKMTSEGLLGTTSICTGEDMLTNSAKMIAPAIYDTATQNFVGATSCHGYSDGISPAPNTAVAFSWRTWAKYVEGGNPAKRTFPVMQTETSGYMNWDGGVGGDGNQCPGAKDLATAMFAALKYGHIAGWFWWRLSVTSAGWIDETLIYNGTPNKNYYVSKQYYKYIRPGAVMMEVVDTLDKEVGAVAFNHKTDKTLVMVFVNSGTADKQITLTGKALPATFDKYVTSSSKDFKQETAVGTAFTLDAGSITTLVGKNYTPPAVVGVKPNPQSVALRKIPGLSNDRQVGVYTIDGRIIKNAATSSELSSIVKGGNRARLLCVVDQGSGSKFKRFSMGR